MNWFLKHSLFGRLFSRNAKKTHTDLSTIEVFLVCPIKTIHKPSKVAGTKNFFSSAYVIDATCFDEWFLLHVMPLSLNRYIVAFFETSVLKEVCFFYVIFTIKVQCKYKSSKIKQLYPILHKLA